VESVLPDGSAPNVSTTSTTPRGRGCVCCGVAVDLHAGITSVSKKEEEGGKEEEGEEDTADASRDSKIGRRRRRGTTLFVKDFIFIVLLP